MPLSRTKRPIAFVLAASNHGTMLVNRYDYASDQNGYSYGVGAQILNLSGCDQEEVDLTLALLEHRRKVHQNTPGYVVALDCGANIGVHTIEWARMMFGWGQVMAFEPQERIFYALAGNITIK